MSDSVTKSASDQLLTTSDDDKISTASTVTENQVAEPLNINQDEPKSSTNNSVENVNPEKGSSWGWGWSSVWSSSVSVVTESAQAIGKGLGSVVSSVEETLGVPSPQQMRRDTEETSNDEQGMVVLTCPY